MTEEERNVITSEDYADFIIDYRYNPAALKEYNDSVVHVLNDAYAVVYIPVPLNLDRLVSEYGYSDIPKLFGLVSEEAIKASGVDKVKSQPNLVLTGKDVLVGIIDTGIDYKNAAFLKTDGTTKISFLWDQTIESESYPPNMFFGTEYSAEQINQALSSVNPLDIVPSVDNIGHGTMMAGVSVGTEDSSAGFEGVAPDADLVVVKLKEAKKYLKDFFLIPEDAICYQENDIMWGVQYCLQIARNLGKPIAIGIGLGTSQSAHTGQSNLGNFLSIFADLPDTGICIAVGNEGNLGRHFYASIKPELKSTLVELNVGENENSFTMELWGDLPGVYSVDILSPGGEYITRIAASLEVSREISFIFEKTRISIYYQLTETLTGEQLILFRFHNPSSGVWRFNVYVRGDLPASFHIWLPMGNFISNKTYFIQSNIYTTILAPSTAYVPIAVTAYNALNGGLYTGASRGYTTDETIKPDIAAPGVNYIAPTLNGKFMSYSGTSVATAHTAGIAALFLQWAVVEKNFLGVDTIVMKHYLIRGAERESYLTYPNRDWGYGKINIFNTFDILTK